MITVFNQSTIWKNTDKPATVHIKADGFINFSTTAVKLLGLTPGMQLTFLTDDNDTEMIFFYEDKKQGIPLRKTAECKNAPRLSILCRPLALKLLVFFKMRSNTTFRIKADTTKVENLTCWFINKTNIHIPVDWKPKTKANV